tara:strand:+ start:368 stop:541 length:174 start_codon:yes stop_codon:yes gene_type:complete
MSLFHAVWWLPSLVMGGVGRIRGSNTNIVCETKKKEQKIQRKKNLLDAMERVKTCEW